MNRRDFNRSLLGISTAALLGSIAESSDSEIAERFRNVIVMDSLCGIYAPGAPPTAGLIAAALQSGITAIHNTISDDTEDPFENLDELAQAVASYPDALTIIRKHSDIARRQTRKQTWDHKGLSANLRFREQARIYRDLPHT
jgi:hypothetical protein